MKILGGRPMRLIRTMFTDNVSGRSVGLYEDTRGRQWMAEGPWSLFRVSHADQPEPTIRKTRDGQAMVDTGHRWIPITEQAPPSGPKLLLIDRKYGVAVLGSYTKNGTWTHWAALPTFQD